MPNPLSMDLRKRIVKEIDDGIFNLTEISKKFEVSYPTVIRLNSLYKKQGHVIPKPTPRNTGNTKIKDLKALEEFVIKNPNLYQAEVAKKFDVAQSTICSMLKKLNISRKKKLLHTKKKTKNSAKSLLKN